MWVCQISSDDQYANSDDLLWGVALVICSIYLASCFWDHLINLFILLLVKTVTHGMLFYVLYLIIEVITPLNIILSHLSLRLCKHSAIPLQISRYDIITLSSCFGLKLTHAFCTLQWRNNGHGSVSNHQPHDRLLNRLFSRISKKTLRPRVTGLCLGNSPGPVNSPRKWPVTRKMFPFDDVIMNI